ncbi:MAG: DMT family transporter [Gammaproteobacteria bacterium]
MASCEPINEAESRSGLWAWGLLGVAVCCEIGGAIGLRFSEGFSVPLPTTLALGAFAVALFLVSRVMRELPVSIAYPIWAGGGTAGVALIGILLLGEALTPPKAVGIALIMVGVVLINAVSEKRSGC